MDEDGSSPHIDRLFTPENIPYHRNGRMREDADGLVLSSGASVTVSPIYISSEFL